MLQSNVTEKGLTTFILTQVKSDLAELFSEAPHARAYVDRSEDRERGQARAGLRAKVGEESVG
jgi:hypothetical protein